MTLEDLLSAEQFEQMSSTSQVDGLMNAEEELPAEETKFPSSKKLSHEIQRISSTSKANPRFGEPHATQKSKQINKYSNKSLKTKEVVCVKSIATKEKPKVTIIKNSKNTNPVISEKNAKKNAVSKTTVVYKHPAAKVNSKPGPKSSVHHKKFADIGNAVTPMETNYSNMPPISEASSSIIKCSTNSKHSNSHKLRVTVPKSPKFATRYAIPSECSCWFGISKELPQRDHLQRALRQKCWGRWQADK